MVESPLNPLSTQSPRNARSLSRSLLRWALIATLLLIPAAIATFQLQKVAHWFIGTLMIVFCLLFLVWLGTGNQRLRQLLHRPGFLVSLGFLGAIPFGIIAEVAEWGQMPDKFESGFFCNAMVFATMAYFTRPAEPSTPNAA